MDKKDRKFAVPYNGSDPDEYIEVIKPYLNNIDSIYFGLEGVIENNNDKELEKCFSNSLKKESNTYKFLEKTKENFPKRLLVCNSMIYKISPEKMKYWIYKNLIPLIDIYKLNGVIVSEFFLAREIRNILPNLEIQTSCNSCHFSIENFKKWKEEIGVSVFNPPRDIARHPDDLKKIHEKGYKIKCLVNELCIVGCPEHCSHFIKASIEYFGNNYKYCKIDSKLSDVLKCGFILPQWYDFYDQYINVYKLVGRNTNNESLKTIFDCFINCNLNYNFFEVMIGDPKEKLINLCKNFILIKNIPRKLIDCNQTDCEKCNICENIIKKYLKYNNVELTEEILRDI